MSKHLSRTPVTVAPRCAPTRLTRRMFWEAIRAGYMSLELQRKFRPVDGGRFYYSSDDHREFVRTIAAQLGFLQEDDMTDYGCIIRGDDLPDMESTIKTKRCSTSNNLGLFIRHLANLSQILKDADKDGFCLDELLNALPEFEGALKSSVVR